MAVGVRDNGCCVGEPWRAEWVHEEGGGVGSREGGIGSGMVRRGGALGGTPAVRGGISANLFCALISALIKKVY